MGADINVEVMGEITLRRQNSGLMQSFFRQKWLDSLPKLANDTVLEFIIPESLA